mmetsp:Transcript_8647/g.10952  ORF Transcript_8647/g.10952 Transcript_8647/m.10952 type:complete len:205 (-) Transcript_8647:457-1071(-)|eukprot:CAMPEP_0185750250 /NCGR_PEP_ID=MMETSP1174-20130828/9019_1 /TAXON_ID=35687 /ORGANISM="Dictyocha speculum, Strain CCMP1381" /LENGTH=204 /DNA_ID=CAMNT_0028426737 /DNA_START=19 /DNA_END=633 /DNA_ORIENTATION=+
MENTEEPIATLEMCEYCFDVLHAHFEGRGPPVPRFPTGSQCPMFITWNTSTPNGLQLRGCIGTLSPIRLSSMTDYVHSSAFNDRRFEPISAREVASLHCSVSLLVQYEDASDAYDWEVGVHGILISFRVGSKKYSATYLPEVAREQGWNQSATLKSLVRKAGADPRTFTDEGLRAIHTTRYQSSKYALSYTEYMALKQQNAAHH